MLLVFCPDDDAECAANVPVARHLASFKGRLLEGPDALRSNLLRHVESPLDGLVLMGHGSTETVAEQGGGNALTITDFQYYKLKPTLAYTCFSAHLGQVAAENGIVWWGYENVMQPPPVDVVKKDHIENLFRYLAHRYWKVKDSVDAVILIEEVKQLSEDILEGYEIAETTIMSCSMFFRHVWSRLRVWLPDTDFAIRHGGAFRGQLDWRDDV